MVISFSHVIDNVVHLYQRDIHTLNPIRKIKVDLNGLETINFDDLPEQIREAKEVTIRIHSHRVWMEVDNPFRRKCINCGKGSNSTYCKKCWSEIG